jgi:hypothetical protein
MQPSRRHCLWASLAALVFFMAAPRAHADTLTITSTPAGATVELDGIAVGVTPYRANFPGGYFHKTHSVFGARLNHAMTLRVTKDGYVMQQMNITEGPMDWVALTGRHDGTYFLLKSNHIEVTLVADSGENAGGISGMRAEQGSRAAKASLSQDDTDDSGQPTHNGVITFRSTPSGADIYVDGNFAGQTPSTLRLASGAHHVEVRLGNHPAWTKDFNLLKGSDITLRANFGGGDSDGGAVDAADTKK